MEIKIPPTMKLTVGELIKSVLITGFLLLSGFPCYITDSPPTYESGLITVQFAPHQITMQNCTGLKLGLSRPRTQFPSDSMPIITRTPKKCKKNSKNAVSCSIHALNPYSLLFDDLSNIQYEFY